MGKGLNPADAFRKEQKKKEIKKGKKERDEIREVRSLLNDPTKVEAEIAKLQKESNANKLDKGLKERIKDLERMKEVALNKQKIRDRTLQLKEAGLGRKVDGDSSPRPSLQAGGAQLAPPRPLPSQPPPPPPPPVIQRKPEESVYYHPSFNPSGAPPPGQPQLFRPLPPSNSSQAPSAASTQFQYQQRPLAPGAGHRLPMGGLAVGGMHGIPLPPPRLSVSTPMGMGLAGVPPSQNPAPFSQQLNKIPERRDKRQAAGPPELVDPLDPRGVGYTDRFQKTEKKAKLEQVAGVEDLQALENSEMEAKEEQNIEDRLQPLRQSLAPQPSAILPTPTAPTAPHTSVIPPTPSSPQPDSISASRQDVQEKLRALQRQFQQTKSCTAAAVSADGPASISKDAPNAAVLSSFCAYGDSDDENSDADSEVVSGPGASGNSASTSSQPFIQVTRISAVASVDLDQCNSIGPVGPSRPGFDALGEPAQATALPPAPANLTSLKSIGPKVTKVDSALTAFLPAALRSKKPVAARPALAKPVPTTTVTTIALEVKPAVSKAVDDAYSEFMAEIGDLTEVNDSASQRIVER